MLLLLLLLLLPSVVVVVLAPALQVPVALCYPVAVQVWQPQRMVLAAHLT